MKLSERYQMWLDRYGCGTPFPITRLDGSRPTVMDLVMLRNVGLQPNLTLVGVPGTLEELYGEPDLDNGPAWEDDEDDLPRPPYGMSPGQGVRHGIGGDDADR